MSRKTLYAEGHAVSPAPSTRPRTIDTVMASLMAGAVLVKDTSKPEIALNGVLCWKAAVSLVLKGALVLIGEFETPDGTFEVWALREPETYEADVETAWEMAHREVRTRRIAELTDVKALTERVQGLWDRGLYTTKDVWEAGFAVSREGTVFDPARFASSMPRWGEGVGYIIAPDIAERYAHADENRRNADDITNELLYNLRYFNVADAREEQLREAFRMLQALANKLPE